MKTNRLLINILISLLLVLGLWLGYKFLFSKTDEDTSFSKVVTETGGEETALVPTGPGSEFVILLSRLRNVTLDASFLSNQTFTTSLEDFSTALPARSHGRRNPFALFGVGNVQTGSGSQSNSTTTSSKPPVSNSGTGGDQNLTDEQRQAIIDSFGGGTQ